MRSIHWRMGLRTTGKSADFAFAIDDFLVGQDGAELLAPPDRRFGDVGQALDRGKRGAWLQLGIRHLKFGRVGECLDRLGLVGLPD